MAINRSSQAPRGAAGARRRSAGASTRPARSAPRSRPAAAVSSAESYDFADIVSGQMDAAWQQAEGEQGAELPSTSDAPKRVLQPEAQSPKLHKVLAQAGLGSRLEMERFIAEGRLTVNNAPAHVGQRVQVGDMIKLDGKPVRVRIEQQAVRVLAYHKPAGEVVTHDDPQNRPTVFRRMPYLAQGKWQSVGRLDLNTEGLLLLTNSGDLANRLMHPRFGLEREYAVRVLGALTAEERQQLLDGVMLEDGMAAFGSIDEGGGEGANVWYRVTISEGRNREVRRIFEAVGRAVSRLIRIRYGAMQLPRGLRRGAYLELDHRDIAALVDASGADKALLRKPEAPKQNIRRQADRVGSRAKADVNAAEEARQLRARRAGKPRRPNPGAAAGAEGAPKKAPTLIGHDSLQRAREAQKRRAAGKRGGAR